MNANTETARNASFFYYTGALIHAAKNWTSVLENFPYGGGALILYLVLFQSKLTPQWLSVWGLIGAGLMLLMGLLRLFGHPVVYLAIPLILNEMVLAVWLLFVGFNSSALASTIAGVLFIIALASTTLSGVFLGSTNDPNYLTAVSENENRVLLGVLFQITLTASVVAIPIVLYPILNEQRETLSLGYIVARGFEGIADAVIALCPLLLLTLSREFEKAEDSPK